MEFIIQPMNMGEKLNYSETFEGTIDKVRKKADIVVQMLQQIFNKGSFTVNVLTSKTHKINYTAVPKGDFSWKAILARPWLFS